MIQLATAGMCTPDIKDILEQNWGGEVFRSAGKPLIPDGFPDVHEKIGQATLLYPTRGDGVNTGFLPQQRPTRKGTSGTGASLYPCPWETCDHTCEKLASSYNHVRRCHLGIALGCIFCSGEARPSVRWYSYDSWASHMSSVHASIPRESWFVETQPDPGQPPVLPPSLLLSLGASTSGPTLRSPPKRKATETSSSPSKSIKVEPAKAEEEEYDDDDDNEEEVDPLALLASTGDPSSNVLAKQAAILADTQSTRSKLKTGESSKKSSKKK